VIEIKYGGVFYVAVDDCWKGSSVCVQHSWNEILVRCWLSHKFLQN